MEEGRKWSGSKNGGRDRMKCKRKASRTMPVGHMREKRRTLCKRLIVSD